MKFLTVFFTLLIVSCSSSEVKVAPETVDAQKEEGTVLVSKCPKQCLDLISSNYTIDSFSTFLGRDKPVSDYVILVSINGVNGRSTYFEPTGSFNSSLNGKFQEMIPSGETILKLRPTSFTSAPDELIQVTFQASPNSKYFIGSMGWRSYSEDKRVYIRHWHPVVVDLTKNEIVHPSSDPQWRKYCFANREFGSAVSCP